MAKAMSKSELVQKIAAEQDLSNKQVKGVLESLTTVGYKELKKNGMNVAAPSAQLKADFQKIGATMTEEWLQKAGADGKAIIDAFKK